MNERQREKRKGGGKRVGGSGRRGERASAYSKTDQEYSTDLEDESGGRRGLLADKLR